MKLPVHDLTSNSTIRKVATKIGDFTIYFPYAVFNPQDSMNAIPKVFESFPFVVPEPDVYSDEEEQRAYNNSVHDFNAIRLQDKLNEVAKFGTINPGCVIDLYYSSRKVVVR